MRILNDKIEKSMSKLSLEIKRFLKENGGMSNGYNTYIHADFSPYSASFKWSTATSKNLTGEEKDKKSIEFSKRIRNLLFEDVTFKVRCKGDDYGSFKVFISVTETKEIYIGGY